MPGTFFGIEIGRTGLAAAQIGQDVTGNNIANAGTLGYSVESAHQEALSYNQPVSRDTMSNLPLGSGVVVNQVLRARDQFLDTQVRDAASATGLQTSQRDALNQVGAAFNEPSDTGLNATLGKFFTSFQDLANNPEDLGVRAATVQKGDGLARVFQGIQQSLGAIGTSLGSKAKTDVQKINDYSSQIAALNSTIRQYSTSGQSPNDLLDQRDLLVDKLAGLANITTQNNSDGTVSVSIGATALVDGKDSYTVTQSGLSASGDLKSGDLAGVTAAQIQVTAYQGQLNTLAASVVSQVNAVHSAGVGLNGTTTGLNFFNASAGSEASTIAVNSVLQAHPEDVAAAAAPAPPALVGAPGDGSNATILAGIENKTVTAAGDPLQNTTVLNYYKQTVADAGGRAASASTASDSAGASLTQLGKQRDSVTGVVTDTEMVNMMKYQRAYQASARVVQTMDDMVGTLITGLFSGR